MEEIVKEVPGIITAFGEIMVGVGAVGKNDRNQQQNFNFRSIDAVYNELHKLFAKHGVVCFPHYVSHQTETYVVKGYGDKPDKLRVHRVVVIDYKFVSTVDGSERTIRAIGEGADFGDKSLSKSLAIADKYALLQAFKIPTEDVKDPDFDTTGTASPQNNQTPRGYQEVVGCATADQQHAIVNACSASQIPVEAVLNNYGYDGLKNIPGDMTNKILDYLLHQAERLNNQNNNQYNR